MSHVVQGGGNDKTETAHFVVRFKEVGNHDRHHAGRMGGANAVVRVLQRQARRRRHAQSLGGDQERIGAGFAAAVVAVGNDCLEPVEETDRPKLTLYSGVTGRCGDRARHFELVKQVQQLGGAR